MTTSDYYSQVRLDLLPLIKTNYNKVFEVGCGQGQTLKYLKEHIYANQTYGIENHVPSAKIATQNVDKVWTTNAEELKLPSNLKFDLVLLPDILEHLINPWKYLENLHKNLNPKADLIISLPNVQHFSVIKQLLSGRWDYTNEGIMDQTHLHYFTKQTAIELITNSGYSISEVKYNGGHLPGWKSFLNNLSGNRLRPWFISQWLFLIKNR